MQKIFRSRHCSMAPSSSLCPSSSGTIAGGTKQCLALWNDIIRVGKNQNSKGHFLGSVVYIAAEENTADLTRWLLIDGQQRLTTLTLILLALRTRLKEHGDEPGEDSPSPEAIDDYYLRNRYGKGDRRYKLHLRRADHETLAALAFLL